MGLAPKTRVDLKVANQMARALVIWIVLRRDFCAVKFTLIRIEIIIV